MADDFQVEGRNATAPFTLKIHRGEGMALIAMNWKQGRPPAGFVGFGIEYREPGGDRYYALKNRLTFPGRIDPADPNRFSTLRSPIQKFRWVHFPRNAGLKGDFAYRVTPVFMNAAGELSHGEGQSASLALARETYPGRINVAFTRGFVSSQAFVDRYESVAPISTLIPAKAKDGLKFVPTHPKAGEALAWMGFEARRAILEVLDRAIADGKARVRVVAYDLSEPEVVSRLEKLGSRLKIIIDNEGDHAAPGSGENQAAARLRASAGSGAVKRQKMGKLQHNKTIVVDGPKGKTVVCGSTNFTWRGLYVQSNNAMVLHGTKPCRRFLAAFDHYWLHGTPAGFGNTDSAEWADLGYPGIRAKVAFSPHTEGNAVLQSIADDIRSARSCLFYSLAFLYQTPGIIQDALRAVTGDAKIFVYGISDRKVGGIDLQKPDGNVAPVFPSALAGRHLPEPFRSEPVGGSGNRMHHKFVVLDFNRPDARVYLGSYNFSRPADLRNGENLLLIRDRRIAVAYLIEALRIFDHYHFRVARQEEKQGKRRLELARPPVKPGEKAWWDGYYSQARKIRDRQTFA